MKSLTVLLTILLSACATTTDWDYSEAAEDLDSFEQNGSHIYAIEWKPLDAENGEPVKDLSGKSKRDLNDCVKSLSQANAEKNKIISPPPNNKIFPLVKIISCMNTKKWTPSVTEAMLVTNVITSSKTKRLRLGRPLRGRPF